MSDPVTRRSVPVTRTIDQLRAQAPATPPASEPVTSAVIALQRTGGLVVFEGAPGSGKTYLLDATAGHLSRIGWQVIAPAQRASVPVVLESLEGPLAVVLDDADAGGDREIAQTTALLRGGAVAVVTRTCGRPLPGPLREYGAGLLEESLVRIVTWRGVPDDAMESLVTAAAPGSDAAFVGQVLNAAAGNPAVARHLASTRDTGGGPGLDEFLVGRLLDRFGVDTRLIARILAALRYAGPQDLDLVTRIADLPEVTTARCVDSLLNAGILGPDQDPGRLEVRPPWLREALYAELGPAERERMHHAAVRTLAQRPIIPHALIAHHLLASASPGDESGLRQLTDTADALCATAPTVSIECYRRVLRHLEDDPQRVAEITARLTRACLLAGLPEDAVDIGRALLSDLQGHGSPAYPWLLPVVTEAMKATSAVSEAEQILLSTSDADAGHLHDAQVGYLLAASGRDNEADSRIHRAQRSLSQLPLRTQVNVLTNLLHTHCIASRFADTHRDTEQLIELVEHAPADVGLHAWATIAHVLAVEGSPVPSAASAARAEELLPDDGWGIYFPEVRFAQATAASQVGDWDEALRIATDTDAPLAASGALTYLSLMRHVRVHVLANRGELARARRVIAERVGTARIVDVVAALSLAEIEIMEGDLDAARQRIAGTLREPGLPAGFRAALLARLADVAARSEDPVLVDECIDEVQRRWGMTDVSRQVRLECQLAQGDVHADASLLARVRDEAAENELALLEGRALLSLGRHGFDAESSLAGAMAIFGELDAVPWRRRTGSELRSRGLPVPRRSRTDAERLTETELQMARLIQAAQSNKQIAGVMCLSVKTVEAYLSRLYLKVGCRNRLELARALDEGRIPLS